MSENSFLVVPVFALSVILLFVSHKTPITM